MEIREGDVFRWRYKTLPAYHVGDPYWANSCIGIARDGWLSDTFWASDNKGWRYAEAIEQLDLTLLGNLNDFECRQVDPAYYKADDIMDLNHSNSSRGNMYVRRGAQHDREAMLTECKARIAQAEDRVRFEADQLRRLKASHARLEAGETLQWLG